MKKAIRVPVGLCDVAIEEKWERSLSYWMIAKNSYDNGSIYNFSIRKLGTILGISHECARFHYNKWLKEDMIRLTAHKKGKTLTFCGINKLELIADRYLNREMSCRRIIFINQFSNVREQIFCIQSRAVLKNINQQIRSITIRREALQNLKLPSTKRVLSKEELTKWKRATKLANNIGENNLKSINGNIQLSNIKISKLVGCSLSHAKRLKTFMNVAGLIETTKLKGNKLNLKKVRLSDYNLEKKYGTAYNKAFYFKGNVYEFPTTIYSLGYAINPVALVGFTGKVKV